jgi:2-methylcitrate dehydratase PrpD
MDATRAFAEFAHDLSAADLSPAAADAAGRLALDTVGVSLAAWDAPGVRELRAVLPQWGGGPCRAWIGGETLSPPAAALVNAAMAHALEYDDLHCELPIHTGVVAVPAVLTMAAAVRGVTGADAACAIVAATEVICRLGRATNSYFGDTGQRGWSPTAVLAGFGAAAAAGRLLGLDADGIERAIGLVFSQASGSQQCVADGGLVKRMQPGMGIEAGLRAAWLAQAGVTGAMNAIEGRIGYFALYEAGDYDPAKLTDGLGEPGGRLEIEDVGFKRYPICGMAHPAVDALRELQAEIGFTAGDVAELAAFGSVSVMDMIGRPYAPGANPSVDAQFNLAYCLASVLLTGNMRLADLAPGCTLDAGRREWADRIPVRLDEGLKGQWTARVEVTLRDGARLTRERDKAAGQSDNPVSTEELLAKFEDCNAAGGPALSADAARTLAALLLDLPNLPSLAPIQAALAPTDGMRRDR